MAEVKDEILEIFSSLVEHQGESQVTGEALKSRLERLKVLGREQDAAAEMSSEVHLKLLVWYALRPEDGTCSSEALRCLVNTCVLIPEARNRLHQQGSLLSLLGYYPSQDMDREFLLARVLFLSVAMNEDIADDLARRGLGNKIVAVLDRHVVEKSIMGNDSVKHRAFGESLKLFYHFVQWANNNQPHGAEAYADCLHPALALLDQLDPKHDSTFSTPQLSLFSILFNMPATVDYFPLHDPMHFTHKLIFILDTQFRPEHYNTASASEVFESKMAALVILVCNIYKAASLEVSTDMQQHLLPRDE